MTAIRQVCQVWGALAKGSNFDSIKTGSEIRSQRSVFGSSKVEFGLCLKSWRLFHWLDVKYCRRYDCSLTFNHWNFYDFINLLGLGRISLKVEWRAAPRHLVWIRRQVSFFCSWRRRHYYPKTSLRLFICKPLFIPVRIQLSVCFLFEPIKQISLGSYLRHDSPLLVVFLLDDHRKDLRVLSFEFVFHLARDV